MREFLKTRVASAAALMLCGIGGAAAGPIPVASVPAERAPVVAVQYPGPYGYSRPYGYDRPYGAYRPYGYGPGPRWYNNHFGPGAAKERHRTRLDFCRNQPQRC